MGTVKASLISVPIIAITVFSPGAANATNITPSFAGAPNGWTVDRYAPDSFSDVGTFQGRSHVLGIGIGPNGATSNRSAGYQPNFYSTQGMAHAITGGPGDSLSAALFVPQSWSDPTQGARRTDMWGVMTDVTSQVSEYPIIGFTNDGTGIADLNSVGLTDNFIGFRIWSDGLNSGNGGWLDLSSVAVNYGAWNTLSFLFDGSNYNYFVNGDLAATFAAASGTINFSSVLMQAFNFDGNTNQPGAVVSPYTAHWSNVPEPATVSLVSLGLIGIGFKRRKSG